MRIAIVVHGRFHAFELARALIARGHEVRVYTNYTRWATRRMGLPGKYVESFWLEGILSRLLRAQRYEDFLHRLFGHWAAWRVHRRRWDMIQLFDGAAEEALRQRPRRGELMVVSRGCAHIVAQDRLMREESLRTGVSVPRPHPKMIARQVREYALADRVITLSSFARQTFIEEGVSAGKLLLLPLGADLARFRTSTGVVQARAARILSGAPLRLVFAGALSYRKGALDLVAISQGLPIERYEWRIAGQCGISADHLAQLTQRAHCLGHIPQSRLPELHAWGDVFVFPTIEDGFAMVLAEALAGGLPTLTTTNSGGPDLIHEGENGWILPIRSPQRFIERLRWLDCHREELARMVQHLGTNYSARSWDDVAQTMERHMPLPI